jgi:hypothetical protein
MSEMVDRVAKAIFDSIDHAAVASVEPPWGIYYPQARAAIRAMRELPGDPGPRYTAGEYSRRTQEAMVDDALSVTNGDRA